MFYKQLTWDYNHIFDSYTCHRKAGSFPWTLCLARYAEWKSLWLASWLHLDKSLCSTASSYWDTKSLLVRYNRSFGSSCHCWALAPLWWLVAPWDRRECHVAPPESVAAKWWTQKWWRISADWETWAIVETESKPQRPCQSCLQSSWANCATTPFW